MILNAKIEKNWKKNYFSILLILSSAWDDQECERLVI